MKHDELVEFGQRGLPLLLAACMIFEGCVSHTRYVTQNSQKTLVDSVVVIKNRHKIYPISTWWAGLFKDDNDPQAKGALAFIYTLPIYLTAVVVDLIIPAFKTTKNASLELRGRLLSKDQKSLSNFEINFPSMGSDGMMRTDQRGEFHRSLGLLHAQPEQWSGGVKVVTLNLDNMGNIADGGPVQVRSPIAVELTVGFDPRGGHLIVKRRDKMPRLLMSQSNNDRDELQTEWIDGPNSADIVLQQKTFTSKKNKRIARQEKQNAEREAKRRQKKLPQNTPLSENSGNPNLDYVNRLKNRQTLAAQRQATANQKSLNVTEVGKASLDAFASRIGKACKLPTSHLEVNNWNEISGLSVTVLSSCSKPLDKVIRAFRGILREKKVTKVERLSFLGPFGKFRTFSVIQVVTATGYVEYRNGTRRAVTTAYLFSTKDLDAYLQGEIGSEEFQDRVKAVVTRPR